MRISKPLLFVVTYATAIAIAAACCSCRIHRYNDENLLIDQKATIQHATTISNITQAQVDTIFTNDTTKDNITLQYDSLGKLIAINRVRFHRSTSSAFRFDTIQNNIDCIVKDTSNATKNVRSTNSPAGRKGGREATRNAQCSKVMLIAELVIFIFIFMIAVNGFKRKVLK